MFLSHSHVGQERIQLCPSVGQQTSLEKTMLARLGSDDNVRLLPILALRTLFSQLAGDTRAQH